MPQKSVWEKEYSDPQLVTGGTEPQGDVKRFVKWIRKEQKRAVDGMRVLDLGCGLGKNAIFLSDRGATVTGLEISEKAIREAEKRAEDAGARVEFIQHDIGSKYPFKDKTFDLVLDVIASNSLNEQGREVYLKEVYRVLKPGGYFFVRLLCKDGDKNAENLLRLHPGPEKDTYILPGLKLVERVLSKEDFTALYSRNFKIINLERKSSYASMNGKPYKRNYWLAYMQK